MKTYTRVAFLLWIGVFSVAFTWRYLNTYKRSSEAETTSAQQASTVRVFMKPANQTVQPEQSAAVTVWMESAASAKVSAATISLTYPANILQYTSTPAPQDSTCTGYPLTNTVREIHTSEQGHLLISRVRMDTTASLPAGVFCFGTFMFAVRPGVSLPVQAIVSLQADATWEVVGPLAQYTPTLDPQAQAVSLSFEAVIPPSPTATISPSPTPTVRPATSTPTRTPTRTPTPTLLQMIPSADTTIKKKHQDRNFGSERTLESQGDDYRAFYIKFDLRQLANTTIHNARLKLKVTGDGKSRGSYAVTLINNSSWQELRLTYRTSIGGTDPSLRPGMELGRINGGRANQWIELPLTEIVQTQKGDWLSVAVVPLNAKNEDEIRFYSRETAERPVLMIQASVNAAK